MTQNNIDKLVASLDSITVGIHATHLDYINDNNLFYTVDAIVNGGGESWVDPYKRPQLLHHDSKRDAVGRINSYSIEDTAVFDGEPNNYIKLNVDITDKDAIGKIVKGIYLTCSVGSSTDKVRCSICNQSLTTDGLCEHDKGAVYDGKKAYWIIDNITYKENSFVNNPADKFSRIVSIDLGNGPVAYDTFLEDKESILTNFFMEDNMTKKGKLSTDDRAKLADSVFCGPNRSFPAHDEAHVNAGLKLLNDSELDESIVNKIKSSLYRKGKRFDIEPQDSELESIPDLLIFRMDDEFTEDEVTAITSFFDEHPDSDLPVYDEDEQTDDNQDEAVTYDIANHDEIIKGKKDEIISYCDFLLKEYNKMTETVTKLTDDNKSLNDSLSEKDTILNSKEDEINKLLDDNAIQTVDYKKAIIDNILDYKNITDNRDDEINKYDARKIDSLLDTLNDFRSDTTSSIPRVNNNTLTDSSESDNDEGNEDPTNHDDEDQNVSRIDRFFKHNINMED